MNANITLMFRRYRHYDALPRRGTATVKLTVCNMKTKQPTGTLNTNIVDRLTSEFGLSNSEATNVVLTYNRAIADVAGVDTLSESMLAVTAGEFEQAFTLARDYAWRELWRANRKDPRLEQLCPGREDPDSHIVVTPARWEDATPHYALTTGIR